MPIRTYGTIRESASLPVLQDPDPDTYLYRPLTANRQDLPSLDQRRQAEIALYLYRYNPVAHRLLELARDFVIGDKGFTVKASNKKVQKVLEDFWYDDNHNFDRELPRLVLDLAIYGELCLPAYVMEDSTVLLSYVDPLQIARVVPDGFNPRLAKTVYIMSTKDGKEVELPYPVIRKDLEPNSPTNGLRVIAGEGKVGHFIYTINNTSSGLRGVSDLFSIADTLDLFERFIYNRALRAHFSNLWNYDVTVENADKTKLEEVQARYLNNPPQPGAINVHNQFEEWKFVSNDLGGSDASEEAKIIRNFLLGSAGVPDYFFGDSGAGRAASTEMAEPTLKSLGSRQREICDFLKEILEFVLDQQILAGKLSKRADKSFQVIPPRIGIRDLQRSGGALDRIVSSLTSARDSGWLSDLEARNAIVTSLEQLGLGGRKGGSIQIDESELSNELKSREVQPKNDLATKNMNSSTAEKHPISKEKAENVGKEKPTK